MAKCVDLPSPRNCWMMISQRRKASNFQVSTGLCTGGRKSYSTHFCFGPCSRRDQSQTVRRLHFVSCLELELALKSGDFAHSCVSMAGETRGLGLQVDSAKFYSHLLRKIFGEAAPSPTDVHMKTNPMAHDERDKRKKRLRQTLDSERRTPTCKTFSL